MPENIKNEKQDFSGESMAFSEFLENCPPNQMVKIVDLDSKKLIHDEIFKIKTPEISLHCANNNCNGIRFFRASTSEYKLYRNRSENIYLTYICSNCRRNSKTYSLHILLEKPYDQQSVSGLSLKFGEMPPFGPPTPARLLKLIGSHRDLFLQGRRCENQGLGIGAFTYYRRVIEYQKDRLLGEIVRVATKLGAEEGDLAELNAAIGETQFSKALSLVKQGIPQTLLIGGHNPLALLHRALSEGIHDRSDEECLVLATSVRVVLAELSERISQALKDEAELNQALSTLLATKSKPAKSQKDQSSS